MTSFQAQKILVAFCILFSTNLAAEITNPLLDFFSSGLRKEDSLTVVYVDLNEDGIDEVFISTDSKSRNNAKAGRIWDLYVSGGERDFVKATGVDDNVPTFFQPEHFVRLSSGKLGFINYHASNAASGSLGFYFLDGAIIHVDELGSMKYEPGEFQTVLKKTLDEQGIIDEQVNVKSKAIKLSDIYTQNQIDSLKSRKDDFLENYTYGQSEDSDPMNFPVIRKSDGVLVGYEKYGQFTPIKKTKSDQSNDSDVINSTQDNNVVAPDKIVEPKIEDNNTLRDDQPIKKNKFIYVLLISLFGFLISAIVLYKIRFKK